MSQRYFLLSIKTTFLAYVLLLTACAKNLNIDPVKTEKIDITSSSSLNYVATADYFNRLISGTTSRIAELTLFTNLLPKGGDLHHHYSGAMYAETYLDWIDKSGYCICRVNTCKSQNKADSKLVLKFGIATHPSVKGDCISAQAAIEDNRFYRELLERWSDKDYGNHYHEQLSPDEQFFDTFSFFGPVSNYAYHDGLVLLKNRAIAENVEYLETMLKSAPVVDNPHLAMQVNALKSDSTDLKIETALNAYYEFLSSDPLSKVEIEKYVSALEGAAIGIDDANFKLRFQAYVSRNSDPAKVFSGLYSSFSAAKKSKLVVGVNMVGPENGFIAMRDYSLHMKMLRFLKRHFPEVKLALHAGELVLGMVPPEGLKHHINEAVEIAGASRLGHAVDIANETNAYDLLNRMRAGNIAVEINLTSNAFILGVKDEAHPVQLYRKHSVPFVISTDDAGVSRNNLSNEYLLFTSRYRPSYSELKTVVYNSIKYAFLNDDEKLSEARELDRRFTDFEAKIAKMEWVH